MIKTALVTGASSGIGEAIARQLIGDGYRVYAAARRLERMAELAGHGARLLSLDVTDDASMVAAVEAISAESGRLDVLVNNAGYGSFGSLEETPLDEGRRQFEVNVFGLARLTQLALPMMRAQQSGTVVNITSVGGKMYEPLGGWYHASKFAVEGMSDCLRMEVEPLGIRVIIVEPGAIKTEWSGIARDHVLKVSGAGPYADLAQRYARMMTAVEHSTMVSPPQVVAAAVGRALKARRPRTRYVVGGGAPIILGLRRMLSDRLFDGFMRLLVRSMS